MNVTASTIQTVCRVRTFYILAIRPSITIGFATDTATIDEKYNDTPALNASLHWVAGREPCRGEIPVILISYQ